MTIILKICHVNKISGKVSMENEISKINRRKINHLPGFSRFNDDRKLIK